MSLVNIIDRHALLRPLNFLRIRSDYSIWYNWVYPSLLTLVLFLGQIWSFPTDENFDFLAPIKQFTSLLTVLFPFYFASLAATATLNGVPSLDEEFAMKNEVTLQIALTKNEYDTLVLCPRDFLSLLFSYCTTASLFLLLFSFTTGGLEKLLVNSSDYGPIILQVTLAIYLFLVSQLLVSTLLGVYFLSDYMVRNRKDIR